MSDSGRVLPMPRRPRSDDSSTLGHARPPGGIDATTIAILLTTLLFLYLIRQILLPFAFAAIVAFVVSPLLDRLASRVHCPRWICATAFLLALAGLAAVSVYFGGPALVREFSPFLADARGSVERLLHTLLGDRHIPFAGQQLDARQIADYAVDALQTWATREGGMALAMKWGVAIAFGFILTWVLTAYFVLDGPRIGTGLLWLVPPARRPLVTRIWGNLDPILRRYFIGIGVVVLTTSIFAYVGLGLILGIHYALFLALMTGLLETIPIVGPAASAVIAGLVAIGQARGAASILAYALYATALRITIDQVVGPIVLGRAGYVRPVVVIFCFLAGGILFGVVGVVLATPIALALKVTLEEMYRT